MNTVQSPSKKRRNQIARRGSVGHKLAILEEATRLLAEAKTLDDVMDIRDKAEVARIYAKAARLGLELQNDACEIKLRAERKAGEFLADLSLQGGDRRSKTHDAFLKLEDMGLTSDQSRRWQLEASLPEEEFHQFLANARNSRREITAAALMRLADKRRKEGGTSPPPAPSGNGRPHNTGDEDGQAPLAVRRELIAELRHHRAALAEALGSFIEGTGKPTESDRRLAKYELGELARVVEELAEATGCGL